MFRTLLGRDSVRLVLLLVIVAIVITPSVLLPLYFGNDARPIAISSSAVEDEKFLDALQDAYLLEQSGDLQGALAKYRFAADSSNVEIQEVAREGADRTYASLLEIGWLLPDYQRVLRFSRQARAPLIGVLLVVLATALLSRSFRRRGIVILPFSVTPQLEGADGKVFNRMLAENMESIVRVYESDQLSRIGVQITAPDLVSAGADADTLSRALASLREEGLTTVSTFSIQEILHFFQYFGERPQYRLSGNVAILPEGAFGRAKLTKAEDGDIVVAWEASSLEMMRVSERSQLPQEPRQPASDILPQRLVSRLATDDARWYAQHLSDLSIVLASKVWHSLAQSAQEEMRPSSWQTVYHFLRAMNALETAR